MKTRLLWMLGIWIMLGQIAAQEPPVVKKLEETQLMAVPNAPHCFRSTVLRGDPSQTESIMVMKAESGCTAPWHWHPSTETVMMVQGVARVEVKGKQAFSLNSGDYISVPPKNVMKFQCETECTLFLHTDGPFSIHYVDASGNEIPAEQALRGDRNPG